MQRIMRNTTPRKVYSPGRLCNKIEIKADRRHVGLFYWCSYWRHWDQIISVKGNWATVQVVDLDGNQIGETREHCSTFDPAMFADRPFEITWD